ncbi:glutamine amidotransferase subunit pdxT [Talaromyces proteolyticus]|uniref:Pyridoxal 5'-phosphate synthase glutaminase subunit n=1 Tax=Talaromyces proteolyticus TaxID=1131652 RepID=A0AAD4KNV5_9EURO|nr:glutamine amidotransferase subunit pdxT [Talaromyces proteolyticus]KAH8696025.1 glutamine amidotransferase subunit pdxT [Talaromyces proteolyticus]
MCIHCKRKTKMIEKTRMITVGVLALQGAFYEHIQLLKKAANILSQSENGSSAQWQFIEVRTKAQLDSCDALVLPGGESTTISLVAASSDLLEPLRDFVKLHRRPTWGTCAGLILLAESANRTKKGGQELIGGIDVRVNRNHFGRQAESFQAPLELPFLPPSDPSPFNGVFIRAPVVEKILPSQEGIQIAESRRDETVVAPSRAAAEQAVEVLAKLPGRTARLVAKTGVNIDAEKEAEDIIAVKQGNVFGTSFHPELTDDPRIHLWWLRQVQDAVKQTRESG